jgi:hypothetical protein
LLKTRVRQHTLQRTNTENSKQIFPEKELRGRAGNPVAAGNTPNLFEFLCNPMLQLLFLPTHTKNYSAYSPNISLYRNNKALKS